MRVTAALITVVVIAVGLPSAAWVVGGRRFWSRLPGGPGADYWGDTMRRFDLSPQETAQVEGAVTWGRRLGDDRLRQAAAAWARALVDRAEARRRICSRWARVLVGVTLLLLWIAGAVWYFGFVEGEFPWSLAVLWLVIMAVEVRLLRGPRRALRLNSDSSEAPPSGAAGIN